MAVLHTANILVQPIRFRFRFGRRLARKKDLVANEAGITSAKRQTTGMKRTSQGKGFCRREKGFCRREKGFCRREKGFCRREKELCRREKGLCRREIPCRAKTASVWSTDFFSILIFLTTILPTTILLILRKRRSAGTVRHFFCLKPIQLWKGKKNGASEEIRTLDSHLGKVVLYQLSYTRTVGIV